MTGQKEPTPFAVELGRRLRAVRQGWGLSLHKVEERSGGRWKAVNVAAWERGDRTVSAEKLTGLAAFYGVPASRLLPAVETEVRL
jgi:transcriptional regulator with XRE-family HTH domain